MRKIKFKGKLSVKGTFVSFDSPLNARGEKGRQLAAKIKQFIIQEAELQFMPPIIFCPPELLDRVQGTEFQGAIEPPAPEWAQLKEALLKAASEKN